MAPAPRPLQINITLGTVFKILFAVLCLVALYLVRDLLLVVLLSVVIASAIEPAASWLGRYRLPRAVAVLLIYLLAIGLFLVLLPIFILPILSDLGEISGTIGSRLGGLSDWWGASSWSDWTGNLGLGSVLSVPELVGVLQGSFASVPRGFVQVTGLIFGGFFRFILVIVISFYLAVQPNGIENFLRIVTPVNREQYVIDLWRRSRQKIGLWMQGQLLLGLIIGILVFLGLTILQVRYALVLAILAALFELIPYFGPILSAVPAVLLGFSEGLPLGLMVLGLYIIMQQFENHLIYPLVVKKIVGVPPLVVILSLLIGAKLAGFMGLLLAVPLAAVLMEAAGDFEKSKYLVRKLDVKE